MKRIYAILNNIEKKLLHVRNRHERHRNMIARYEQKHGCDIDICVAVKKKKTKITIQAPRCLLEEKGH